MTISRPKRRPSAGLLLYRSREGGVEVLLGHPGGPFWARRDLGAWTIPKGECDPGEEPLAGALREFGEETGHEVAGTPVPLGEAVQRSRKVVIAFALAGDLDPAALRSNLFELEWPPRSGRVGRYPELDRVGWFTLDEARGRILAGQAVFLDRLAALLGRP